MNTLSITDIRTYLYSVLFVLGNIAVPQLCHLIPQGGLILLPIYFFTLVAAYRYGIVAGMLTALVSPIINHLLFAMPPLSVLPILLIKSSLLAIFASLIAKRVGKVSLGAVALAVVGYQLVGTLFEWPMTGSLTEAFQDIRIGYAGLMIQVFLGYFVLKTLQKIV